MGMHPVGCYDLRDAEPAPLPVVSTAFRPVDRDELARNPFRVFTSVLVPEDRRFFDADLQARVQRFLAARTLFPPELLELADRAVAEGGLAPADSGRFLDLATSAFALSPEPIDQGWYDELAAVSGVAADIAGVTSTHVNHLTPRVLDIDLLYRRMQDRGVEMIDEIQGPPRWDGPDVLLRQTSFRALAEPRLMRAADGAVAPGELRVRFGEVEARGIALTPAGRDVVDPLPPDPAAWAAAIPGTERGAGPGRAGLVHAPRWRRRRDGPGARPGAARRTTPTALVDDGWVRLDPVVYEDFLPRSAAGIFRSNLADDGTRRRERGRGRAGRRRGWPAPSAATCTTRWTCTPRRSTRRGHGCAPRSGWRRDRRPRGRWRAGCPTARCSARTTTSRRTSGRGAASRGRAAFVARPATWTRCATVVRWAVRHRVPLVPQGANTGLVGASVPGAGRLGRGAQHRAARRAARGARRRPRGHRGGRRAAVGRRGGGRAARAGAADRPVGGRERRRRGRHQRRRLPGAAARRRTAPAARRAGRAGRRRRDRAR